MSKLKRVRTPHNDGVVRRIGRFMVRHLRGDVEIVEPNGLVKMTLSYDDLDDWKLVIEEAIALRKGDA